MGFISFLYDEALMTKVLITFLGFATIVSTIGWYVTFSRMQSQRRRLKPIDVIESRFARGQLSESEFERLKQHLRLRPNGTV